MKNQLMLIQNFTNIYLSKTDITEKKNHKICKKYQTIEARTTQYKQKISEIGDKVFYVVTSNANILHSENEIQILWCSKTSCNNSFMSIEKYLQIINNSQNIVEFLNEDVSIPSCFCTFKFLKEENIENFNYSNLYNKSIK